MLTWFIRESDISNEGVTKVPFRASIPVTLILSNLIFLLLLSEYTSIIIIKVVPDNPVTDEVAVPKSS